MAAAKGRQQSAASLLLDLAKFYEHVGHDHLWEEGQKTRFPTRLLACWCASYEGWRFLEADKCAIIPFWASGTILPRCSGATTAAKLMLATLLETVATRLPTYRVWNVVDDISGHVAGIPNMVQVLTAEAARLLVEGLQARDQAAAQGRGTIAILLSLALNAGVLWVSEVLGFTPTQLQSIRVDAAKATCWLSRGQNAATTMLANAQAAGGKNIDPAFRHHRLVILAWATGVWEGTPDLNTVQAALRGSLARLSHLKRPWCGLERAVCEAPHDPRRHQDRPPGSGPQNGRFLGRPGTLFVVRQLCTLELVQGPALLGSHQVTPCFWQA